MNSKKKEVSNEYQISHLVVYTIKRIHNFQNDKIRKRRWMKERNWKQKIMIIHEIKDFINTIDSMFNRTYILINYQIEPQKKLTKILISWALCC